MKLEMTTERKSKVDLKALESIVEEGTDIGSVEGVSADQITRSRLSFLLTQNQSIIQMTQMADAKSAAMLALFGVLAAHFATSLLESPTVSAALFLAVKAILIMLCLWVLSPRLITTDIREEMHVVNRYSWLSLTGTNYGEAAHGDFMQTSQASELVVSVARTNVGQAKALLKKFRLLQMIFAFSACDVLAMLAYVMLLHLA